MGELLLCDKPIAAMPFYIEGLSVNVYSLEELNYYILNNTFLIDNDFMSQELCDWIRDEAMQPKLADELEKILDVNGKMTDFIFQIIEYTGYCTKSEKLTILENVSQLEEKSDFECSKLRADKLMEKEKYLNSIYAYKKLLELSDDQKEDEQIKAQIMHNLGTAYARLFLFEDAVKFYRQAYKINHNKETLTECLMACICMHDNNAFRITADEFGVSQDEINSISEMVSAAGKADEIVEFEDKIDTIALARKTEKNQFNDEIVNIILAYKEQYRRINRI